MPLPRGNKRNRNISAVPSAEVNHFQNQVAVVTGASSGIGRAIALDFARRGAEVCLVARREKLLESIARQIQAAGGRAHVYRADLTRDKDVRNLVGSIERNLRRVGFLVLCGGAIFHGTIEQATLDQFDLQYRSNLRCHYALSQAFLPLLRRQRGQIVFINSSAATRPAGSGMGQFAATQCALRAIADSLRDEVNAQGIRVLSVYPGRTATSRTASLFKAETRSYRPKLLLQPEDIAAMVASALSLPRTAEVTDISMRPMQKSY
jgi:NADP-dependent 3-hydroxy acid dehydrogenase YdfG